jgi:hypothetical protein
MERSTFEKLIVLSASQEIFHIILDVKIHDHIHYCPPLASILSQVKPIHTL